MAFEEEQFLPFSASPLRGEAVLVIAPHPDDEVIGCGGLLALHAREGRRVEIVVVSDGTAGMASPDAAVRERESEEGTAILGLQPPRFLRLPDRALSTHQEQLRPSLRERLTELRPDLILVPSPLDIHPDHRAVASAMRDLLQSDTELTSLIPDARVAFYETSQPIRPDTLVDITEVAELKFQAIEAHQSQQTERDYAWFARGLAQYRALTLPSEVRYAEAYRVLPVREIRTRGWESLLSEISTAPPVSTIRGEVPITVIVRTKDRPELLRQAVESIRANPYPASIIVVNDGGTSPREILQPFESVRLIDNPSSVGRSEAMNLGVRDADTRFIAFLDDDDLFYPDHLQTLANAAASDASTAWYTDAASVSMERDAEGGWTPAARLRTYARDYDPDLLVFDNYIPLLTLLVSRDDYLEAGGFSHQLDLFEDWDFLLRLSRRGTFRRIPRLTCEIRHYPGAGSAVLAAPAGSPRFREAKEAVWSRHRDLITDERIATVFEEEKQRTLRIRSRWEEEAGRGAHLTSDIARLEREKNDLLLRMQEEHERAAAAMHELGGRLQQTEVLMARLQEEYASISAHTRELELEIARHTESGRQRDIAITERNEEIVRLNGLLDQIYQSRSWKLHQLLEKIRGH